MLIDYVLYFKKQHKIGEVKLARKVKTTKLDIIQCASKLFLEQGYSNTSPRNVCDILDISTGNLTYYFPTKEHLLAEVVQMLCDFQREMMKKEAKEDISSVMAICIELTAMASMCEQDETAKDFFLAAYTSPICLEIIRNNDVKRAQEVFKDYCPDWAEEQFEEAEIIVSGIEYATLMTTGDAVTLKTRIEGALENILTIYCVPEEVRKKKVSRALEMDYRNIGARVLEEFRLYVERMNEKALEALITHSDEEVIK